MPQNPPGKPMRIPESAHRLIGRVHLLRSMLGQAKRTYSDDIGEAVKEWAEQRIPALEAELKRQEQNETPTK